LVGTDRVKIGDGPVVDARVQHDQAEEVAKLKVSPDAQIVLGLDLADGHPLKVGSNGVGLNWCQWHVSLLKGHCGYGGDRTFRESNEIPTESWPASSLVKNELPSLYVLSPIYVRLLVQVSLEYCHF